MQRPASGKLTLLVVALVGAGVLVVAVLSWTAGVEANRA